LSAFILNCYTVTVTQDHDLSTNTTRTVVSLHIKLL
jgi:hypothetical protein